LLFPALEFHHMNCWSTAIEIPDTLLFMFFRRPVVPSNVSAKACGGGGRVVGRDSGGEGGRELVREGRRERGREREREEGREREGRNERGREREGKREKEREGEKVAIHNASSIIRHTQPHSNSLSPLTPLSSIVSSSFSGSFASVS